MKMTIKLICLTLFYLNLTSLLYGNPPTEDEFIYLEEIFSDKSKSWVEKENKKTLDYFKNQPNVVSISNMYMEIENRKDKLYYGNVHNKIVFHEFSDTKFPRGLYRQKSLDQYLKNTGEWKTILDIAALNKKEKKSWVLKQVLHSDFEPNTALVFLSNGGQDANEVREFNLKSKSFVKNGFFIPESKSRVSFLDKNTLIVADASSDKVKTKVGYPKVIKLLKRGQNIKNIPAIFKGSTNDLSVGGGLTKDSTGDKIILYKNLDFYSGHKYHYDLKTKKTTQIPIPLKARFHGLLNGQLIFTPQEDWQADRILIKAGSLASFNLNQFLLKNKKQYKVLIKNSPSSSIKMVRLTKNHIYMVRMDKIISKLEVGSFINGKISFSEVKIPDNGSAYIFDTSWKEDLTQISYSSFLNPNQIYLVKGTEAPKLIQSQNTKWNSSNFISKQIWKTSKDGVKIPYFIVHKKGLKLNGSNPTLIYGYGGFNITMTPRYSELTGRAWLNRGGVYVLANIRGGGAFGPEWHKSATLFNKQKSYDDFIAIAEDLIAKKITSPKHLGIHGGSNGGLLVGAVTMQRPDLFNAVLCGVPLLDMMRYTIMPNAKGDLVGKSWAAEYGDPIEDQKIAEYIKTYSPYQNIKKNKKYPKMLIYTSTRDDRVVPSHARKMVAKLGKLGHPVWYYENTEGGHGASADLEQEAFLYSLRIGYLFDQLTEKKASN